jgi:hypothetical protein
LHGVAPDRHVGVAVLHPAGSIPKLPGVGTKSFVSSKSSVVVIEQKVYRGSNVGTLNSNRKVSVRISGPMSLLS